MAIDVVIEVTIARPPADVWAVVTDVTAWPTWLIATGIRHVERPDTDPLAAGSPFVIEQAAAGRAGTFAATVATFDPPRRFGISGKDRDGVAITLDADLAPADAGTAVRWRATVTLPFRYRFLEAMAAPQVRRAAALDIEALRLRLEAAGTATPEPDTSFG
jgi:uncharacterized protein YndB with AHSA1/START domain